MSQNYFTLIIGLVLILLSVISILNEKSQETKRLQRNNKVVNDRIEELRSVITDKDITYQARIEELIYMKNNFF